jgi:glycosyltransferase involved in cell wall biosynthesis
MKAYKTRTGEVLLYNGSPNLNLLDDLAEGYGDCWHSSFEQGYKNAFQELAYQTYTAWWYINDFDNLNECVSWRINPHAFVIREKVWKLLGGFCADYCSDEMKGLAFGFDLIWNGGIPLYVKGLFTEKEKHLNKIPVKDHYIFFKKKFISQHSGYMLLRKGFWKPQELSAYFHAKNNFSKESNSILIPPRPLASIDKTTTVSYIIPTMMRQDFTVNLLHDLAKQTYLPTEVIVVDATPKDQRNDVMYGQLNLPFKLLVNWQISKGSCRARNEAIAQCTGEYIIFGDDDIRIPPTFIENHVRLLQTYNAGACNGLDIRADNQFQTLDDLYQKLPFHQSVNKAGITNNFNNANSCVKKIYVDALKGNDINYDGGYGEDADFGLMLTKAGVAVLYNQYAANLHLKPASGGYRWWGSQSALIGKKRKNQPWELNKPVKWITPAPSPTIMYFNLKHFNTFQIKEYKIKYMLNYLMSGSKWQFPLRLLTIPIKLIRYHKSLFYAKQLIRLGTRYA